MPDPIPTVADAERARAWCTRHMLIGCVARAEVDSLAAEFAAAREEGRDAERERWRALLPAEVKRWRDELDSLLWAYRSDPAREFVGRVLEHEAALRTGEQ